MQNKKQMTVLCTGGVTQAERIGRLDKLWITQTHHAYVTVSFILDPHLDTK